MHRHHRAAGLLGRVLEGAAALPLLMMIMVTLVDVAGRYLFHAPLFGSTEMIENLLAISVFAALGAGARRNEYIVVALFEDSLSRRWPRGWRFGVWAFNLLSLMLLAFLMAQHGGLLATLDQVSIVLEWPIAPLAFVAAGCLAAGVATMLMSPLPTCTDGREDP